MVEAVPAKKFKVPEKSTPDSTLQRILQNESSADLLLQVGSKKMKVHSFYLAGKVLLYSIKIIQFLSYLNIHYLSQF